VRHYRNEVRHYRNGATDPQKHQSRKVPLLCSFL
jgi:hypothetical protein